LKFFAATHEVVHGTFLLNKLALCL